jgi:hypothetical protein
VAGGPTVGDALAAFRRAQGLAADEATRPSWTCRLGPALLRLPNWPWRRRAILAHDLHHLLTGIPCTMRGEFQMAAWEFGAGPMPHWGAHLFCLPLVPLGLLWSPRRIWLAFLAGRRTPSLHQSAAIDRLLATPLHEAGAGFVSLPAGASIADRAAFAVLILQAAALLLLPAVGVMGLALAAT